MRQVWIPYARLKAGVIKAFISLSLIVNRREFKLRKLDIKDANEVNLITSSLYKKLITEYPDALKIASKYLCNPNPCIGCKYYFNDCGVYCAPHPEGYEANCKDYSVM